MIIERTPNNFTPSVRLSYQASVARNSAARQPLDYPMSQLESEIQKVRQ